MRQSRASKQPAPAASAPPDIPRGGKSVKKRPRDERDRARRRPRRALGVPRAGARTVAIRGSSSRSGRSAPTRPRSGTASARPAQRVSTSCLAERVSRREERGVRIPLCPADVDIVHALKLAAAVLTASAFVRRWELGPLVCLLRDRCRPELLEASDGASAWLMAGGASFFMVGATGRPRKCLALLPLVGWVVLQATVDVSAPHIGYCSVALAYIVLAPVGRAVAPCAPDGAAAATLRLWLATSPASSARACARRVVTMTRPVA